MGYKYTITGVQLGMLIELKKRKERCKIVMEIMKIDPKKGSEKR